MTSGEGMDVGSIRVRLKRWSLGFDPQREPNYI
jgi:hypothetical protein